ncbi:MAG: substrate-binding domain-containing protein [Mariniblastus sp.]
MRSKRKKVALLIEASNSYARGLLSGVIAFEQQYSAWSIYLPEHQRRGVIPLERLKDWKVDGILARIETQKIADLITSLNVPTVDLSAGRLVEGIPWVETDNQAIAELAANHLLERGFRNFGFLGEAGFNWSQWRWLEFQKYLAPKGHQCELFESLLTTDENYSWQSEVDRLGEWITSLPKPVGIFASYDISAQRLLDVCRDLEIAVPEQVAVIGVDNDSLICEICSPSLTSIELNTYDTGFHAAMLLEKMMNGEEVKQKGTFFGPITVRERLSTDTVAVEDVEVARALEYIRENATYNISVNDVLQHVDISRRKLEIRFKEILGRSPHKEIQYRRLFRVKQLLRDTELSVAEIARLTGFQHPEYLSVVFSRETGIAMHEFRLKEKKN